MDIKKINYSWVVAKCGGAKAISVEVDRHVQTIYKWQHQRSGIPDEYWAALSRMSRHAFEPQDIYFANVKLRAAQARASRKEN